MQHPFIVALTVFIVGSPQIEMVMVPTEPTMLYTQWAGYSIFRTSPNGVREYMVLKEKHIFTKRFTLLDEHCETVEHNYETALEALKTHTGLTKKEVHEIPSYFRIVMHGHPMKANSTIYWFGELCNPDTPIKLSPRYSDYKWVLHEDLENETNEIVCEALELAEVYFVDGMYQSCRGKPVVNKELD